MARVPTISVKLDWLTASWKPRAPYRVKDVEVMEQAEVLAYEVISKIADYPSVKLLDRPMPHYEWAFESKENGARVDIARASQTQGHRLTCTGEVMARVSPNDLPLQVALDMGMKPTRIDVAFDVIGSGVKPRDIANARGLFERRKMERAQRFEMRRSGEMFSAGSRQSEKYLRIYDKAAEQKVEGDWLRLELEMKGAFCEANAELAILRPHQFARVIYDMLDQPEGELWEALLLMAEYGDLLASPPPRVHKPRGQWFEGQVLQALLKWAREDERSARDWIELAETAVIRQAELLERAQGGKIVSSNES